MTKAEKKFGLTIEEIRELKCYYVKQQDFETAVMWREMEREIVPPKKEKKKIPHNDNAVEVRITLVLPDGWETYKTIQP